MPLSFRWIFPASSTSSFRRSNFSPARPCLSALFPRQRFPQLSMVFKDRLTLARCRVLLFINQVANLLGISSCSLFFVSSVLVFRLQSESPAMAAFTEIWRRTLTGVCTGDLFSGSPTTRSSISLFGKNFLLLSASLNLTGDGSCSSFSLDPLKTAIEPPLSPMRSTSTDLPAMNLLSILRRSLESRGSFIQFRIALSVRSMFPVTISKSRSISLIDIEPVTGSHYLTRPAASCCFVRSGPLVLESFQICAWKDHNRINHNQSPTTTISSYNHISRASRSLFVKRICDLKQFSVQSSVEMFTGMLIGAISKADSQISSLSVRRRRFIWAWLIIFALGMCVYPLSSLGLQPICWDSNISLSNLHIPGPIFTSNYPRHIRRKFCVLYLSSISLANRPWFVSLNFLSSKLLCMGRFSDLSGRGHHLRSELPSTLCPCDYSGRNPLQDLSRFLSCDQIFLKIHGQMIQSSSRQRCDFGHHTPTTIHTDFKQAFKFLRRDFARCGRTSSHPLSDRKGPFSPISSMCERILVQPSSFMERSTISPPSPWRVLIHQGEELELKLFSFTGALVLDSLSSEWPLPTAVGVLGFPPPLSAPKPPLISGFARVLSRPTNVHPLQGLMAQVGILKLQRISSYSVWYCIFGRSTIQYGLALHHFEWHIPVGVGVQGIVSPLSASKPPFVSGIARVLSRPTSVSPFQGSSVSAFMAQVWIIKIQRILSYSVWYCFSRRSTVLYRLALHHFEWHISAACSAFSRFFSLSLQEFHFRLLYLTLFVVFLIVVRVMWIVKIALIRVLIFPCKLIGCNKSFPRGKSLNR